MFSTVSIIIILVLFCALAALTYMAVKLKNQCDRYKRGIAVQKGFLQNMSHDIRTPMNAICGFSQILCNSQIRGMLSEEEIAEYGKYYEDELDTDDFFSKIYNLFDKEDGFDSVSLLYRAWVNNTINENNINQYIK